jgi:hypothetical protein
MTPFDTWARANGLIAVGSQLVFTAKTEGKTRLFYVDMSVPLDIPDGMDPETFMRATWLTSAEAEREPAP